MRIPRSPSRQALVLPEHRGPSTRQHGWLIAPVLLLLAVDAGCSRRREPAEEVEWGQPKPSLARRTPAHKPPAEPAGGGGPAGSAPNTGAGAGSGAGSGADGGNVPGQQPREAPGGGAGGAPGSAEDGGPGGAGGTSARAEPKRPAAALPGRAPVKPALSATDAAKSARRLLQRAQQLLRDANPAAAAAAAIEAYDQVLPHAASDADCKKICGQLEGVLTAAGRRLDRVDPVPTRFE